MDDIITLVSSDSESFVVERTVAAKLKILGPVLEGDETCVHLAMAHSRQLSKVLEFAKKDAAVAADFVKDLGDQDLMAMIEAVNYLNYPSLLQAGLEAVRTRVRSMTTEQLRAYLGVVNDFTPEEEEQIANENGWDFE